MLEDLPDLGDDNCKFVGIYALVAFSVHCANHIVIGRAALDRGVYIFEALDERGINFSVVGFGF